VDRFAIEMVTELPTTGRAHTLYFQKSFPYAEMYITDKAGRFYSVGNTSMIQVKANEIIEAVVANLLANAQLIDVLTFTAVGNEVSFTPETADLPIAHLTLANKKPFLAFRGPSKMSLIDAGVPDLSQIKVLADWSAVSWSNQMQAMPGEVFQIFFK
jgi:hypothetical protein